MGLDKRNKRNSAPVKLTKNKNNNISSGNNPSQSSYVNSDLNISPLNYEAIKFAGHKVMFDKPKRERKKPDILDMSILAEPDFCTAQETAIKDKILQNNNNKTKSKRRFGNISK